MTINKSNMKQTKRYKKTKKSEFGLKCPYCRSDNVFPTGYGGFQEADASRGLPMIEAEQVTCNDCGQTWWD
jgi:hypothetical protein